MERLFKRESEGAHATVDSGKLKLFHSEITLDTKE